MQKELKNKHREWIWIYHNKRNTSSRVISHGINLFDKKLEFLINGIILEDSIKAELEKKDNIIDEMATYIGKIDESEDLCNDDICHEGNNCNRCIIEYFINKVEKENE